MRLRFTTPIPLLLILAFFLLWGMAKGIREAAAEQWDAELFDQKIVRIENLPPRFEPLGCPLNQRCNVRWVHCGFKWMALYPIQAKMMGCGKLYIRIESER